MRNRRHDRLMAGHYFSPRKHAGERFWIPIQTFAADGGTRPNFRGRSVSSALLCISFRIKDGRRRRHVSARKFPNHNAIRKRVSLKLSRKSRHTKNALTPTASLDELAEPSYYSNCFHTSSTRDFASQPHSDARGGVAWKHPLLYTTSFPNYLERPAFPETWPRGWKRVHGQVAS
jgi:hypothetical protein